MHLKLYQLISKIVSDWVTRRPHLNPIHRRVPWVPWVMEPKDVFFSVIVISQCCCRGASVIIPLMIDSCLLYMISTFNDIVIYVYRCIYIYMIDIVNLPLLLLLIVKYYCISHIQSTGASWWLLSHHQPSWQLHGLHDETAPSHCCLSSARWFSNGESKSIRIILIVCHGNIIMWVTQQYTNHILMFHKTHLW